MPLNLEIIVPRNRQSVKLKLYETSIKPPYALPKHATSFLPLYRNGYTKASVYTEATTGCYTKPIRIYTSLCDLFTFGKDEKCIENSLLKCNLLSMHDNLARYILPCTPYNLHSSH